MEQKFNECTEMHSSEVLVKNSPNLLEELPVLFDDLSTLTVYLEAAQALLQEQPIDVIDVSTMLERAIHACQRSEEKQRAMLSYVGKIQEKSSTGERFEFETTKDRLCSDGTSLQLFTLSIR